VALADEVASPVCDDGSDAPEFVPAVVVGELVVEALGVLLVVEVACAVESGLTTVHCVFVESHKAHVFAFGRRSMRPRPEVQQSVASTQHQDVSVLVTLEQDTISQPWAGLSACTGQHLWFLGCSICEGY
jgi:hypothetical protein